MKFEDFQFVDSLAEGLDAMGFREATPIQEQAIPIIQAGRDLIACAQTGTGKTAAFLLPILNDLSENYHADAVNALVIAPTRELAFQIDQQVEALGYFTGIYSIPIYGGGGGDNWEQQKKALTQGADIIVATPGRLLAHMQLGYVNFDKLRYLVLDEADRMLDMGFYEDIMAIINICPPERQTLLFSATMPPKIRQLADNILREPAHVNIAISKPAEKVLQVAYLVHDNKKIDLVAHLLNGKTAAYPSVIIFSSTKKALGDITRALQRKNLSARAISSDLEQKEREEVLLGFRNKHFQILVATDIMARGIDIKDISLVINYDAPRDAEDYVHRVGRTARADADGVALTFISANDQQRFQRIERLIGMEIRKVPYPDAEGAYPPYGKGEGQGNRGHKGGGKGRGGGKAQGSDKPREQREKPEHSDKPAGPEGSPTQDKPKNKRRKRGGRGRNAQNGEGPKQGPPPPAQD